MRGFRDEKRLRERRIFRESKIISEAYVRKKEGFGLFARIRSTNRGRADSVSQENYVRLQQSAMETEGFAVHNNAMRRHCVCLSSDLSSKNPVRHLLILGCECKRAIGICTTFQAGEPELHGTVAEGWRAKERNGLGWQMNFLFLWRCNDEWLVSQA